jgi:hypothetical protein
MVDLVNVRRNQIRSSFATISRSLRITPTPTVDEAADVAFVTEKKNNLVLELIGSRDVGSLIT